MTAKLISNNTIDIAMEQRKNQPEMDTSNKMIILNIKLVCISANAIRFLICSTHKMHAYKNSCMVFFLPFHQRKNKNKINKSEKNVRKQVRITVNLYENAMHTKLNGRSMFRASPFFSLAEHTFVVSCHFTVGAYLP